MLIPTKANATANASANVSLNAPQGFMLIPTETIKQDIKAILCEVLMPLRASCSFQLDIWN